MTRSSLDFDLPGSEATEALGRALARSLPSAWAADDALAADGVELPMGMVVYLQGELGAGKTTCVRALLRALGVAGLVRSPTYTLVETYPLGKLTCVHVDLYRLQSLTEVDELGLRDVLGPGCLLLVEWPEKGNQALPPADLDIGLHYAGEARRAGLRGRSSSGAAWLENLGRDSSLSAYVSNLT
jgi:tRNA threonylcarbamoyladenosine biosynthesis protein TsaE